jgi:hypothetical protein
MPKIPGSHTSVPLYIILVESTGCRRLFLGGCVESGIWGFNVTRFVIQPRKSNTRGLSSSLTTCKNLVLQLPTHVAFVTGLRTRTEMSLRFNAT